MIATVGTLEEASQDILVPREIRVDQHRDLLLVDEEFELVISVAFRQWKTTMAKLSKEILP